MLRFPTSDPVLWESKFIWCNGEGQNLKTPLIFKSPWKKKKLGTMQAISIAVARVIKNKFKLSFFFVCTNIYEYL